MKEIFGLGLFIRNDDNGNPCHIGDFIRLTRPESSWWEDGDEGAIKRFIPEKIWEGTLVLLKSKGVKLKTSDGYITPNFTKGGYIIWKWEKLNCLEEK